MYKELNYDEAIKLMNEISKETEDVGIYVDGMGRSTIYDIVKNGNGQKPISFITKATFRKLLKNNVIDENSLSTFKNRRFHAFIIKE